MRYKFVAEAVVVVAIVLSRCVQKLNKAQATATLCVSKKKDLQASLPVGLCLRVSFVCWLDAKYQCQRNVANNR